MTENEQNEIFSEITDGVEIHLEYKTLEGNIVAIGPASGGRKSEFIAYAAAHEGFVAAHRWVEAAEWKIPA
jgi:hypothetical protein